MARRVSLDLTPAQRASLAARLGDAPHEGRPAIAPGPPGSPAPLSFAQQRLWFLHRLEPDSVAYSMTQGLTLYGELRVDALRGALDRLVARHDILRTRYVERAGVPEQIVDPPGPAALSIVDLVELPAEARAARAAELLGAEAARPFDLTAGPVMRGLLIRVAERRHELLINVHHIASDGWSHAILFDELGRLYGDLVAGRAPELPPLALRYADYARWQRAWLTAERRESLLAFWRRALAGLGTLELPLDRPRPAHRRPGGDGVVTRVARHTADRVRALADQARATPFMVLAAAWACALGRITGQDDFGIGTVSAGRARRELEPLIGFFVDTLVVRADLRGAPSFEDIVHRTREAALAAFAHQDLPFEQVVDALAPRRTAGANPLFQVAFVLQSMPAERYRLDGLAVTPHAPYFLGAHFDLLLTMSDEADGGLFAGLGFDPALFDRETARAILDRFVHLLDAAVAAPATVVARLPLAAIARRRALPPPAWNDTRRSYPREPGLHRGFERAADRAPDAAAVIADDEALSYRALDERANQLAHRLVELGVGPEVRVAVYVPRSIDLIVALLAILKAGGSYLPLDPGYPPDRLAFLIDDAATAVVITAEPTPALPERATQLVLARERSAVAAHRRTRPEARAIGASAACVLYTSGSTGRPKGVVISHDSLQNEIAWLAEVFALRGSDRVLQQASIGFDVSVFEMFWALSSGAALVLPRPDAQREPDYLIDLIRRREVTAAFFVPSLLNLFLATAGVEACHSLRVVLVGGEALPLATVAAFHQRLPGRALHNLYGPTETGCTTWHPCRADDARAAVPIGTPIANLEIYLLDGDLSPVAIGQVGELHAGGANVARGYLGRPALTAERFVPDPFSGRPGARLYRTGDRARYFPDGSLEYLGRSDHQHKIRGVRVELGEIEAVVMRHPEVQEAAVLAREVGAGLALVAYVVPRSRPVPASELRRFARDQLPPAMVPSAFVALDRMPLSPNGKADRQALAGLEVAGCDADAGAAPRTPVEELVVGIYATVVGRRVGIDDDFFALGGHSLSAAQVIARVRDAFAIDLPLRAIFETPTAAGLAARIEAARRSGDARAELPLVAGARGEAVPLSFAQQRLWFLDQLAPGTTAYHIPVALRLTGRLDAGALQRSLAEIVRRHEALRTRFVAVAGQPRQDVVTDALTVPVVELGSPPGEAREAELRRRVAAETQRPFDLAAAPPVRATLFRTRDDDHALVFTVHHIVADGWSIGVWMRELGALYAAFAHGQPSPLPPLPIQVPDVAAWQGRWLCGDVLASQLQYWRTQLAGAPPALDLPTDRPRPPVQRHRGAVHDFALPPALVTALVRLGRERNATLFMTLLAAFYVLLRRHTGQDDLVVGTPIANRTRTELEPLIGLFVNTLALRVEVAGDVTFHGMLQRVREVTLGAYAHHDLPFEKLVDDLSPVRDTSRSPLFQVAFALQNTPATPLVLPDLVVQEIPLDGDTTKFDLAFSLAETGAGIAGAIEYSTDLFDAATIARMAGHYEALLRSIAGSPDRRITQLAMLAPDEVAQLRAWGTPADEPAGPGRCLHEAFEAQVDATPDAIAVAHGAIALGYRELDRRANQLARHLRRRGVEPGQRVGLCVDRTPDMIVAILAVWKTGAAHVPLDPSYPAERLRWLVRDARPAVVVTRGALGDAVPADAAPILRLDEHAAAIDRESGERLGLAIDADELAYVIYTSGSSGRPKGVMVAHRGVHHVAAAQARAVGATVGRRVLPLASFSFDASVSEILMALVAGATLVLAGRDDLLPGPDLVATLARERIHIATISPSLLAVLPRAELPALDTVLVAGEACPEELIARWAAPGRRIIDAYGPTEASICATMGTCAAGAGKPAIGRPIARTRVAILDDELGLVPIGVCGELWLEGPGVARGYLDQPGLTADRFVPAPFADRPGARGYRTGDRCRWRADGTLDYVGRIDQQVKLRGQRIELAEIEARLLDAPGVAAAVAVVRDLEHDRRLVAYVVARDAQPIDPRALRDHLGRQLLAVMVPSLFVVLDELPLTPNGKVDRRALPPPIQPAERAEVVAPRTPLEADLVGLWEDMLDVRPIGIRDSFFALGGHSLLAVRLVAQIEQRFGARLALGDLFRGATIADVAAALHAPPRRSSSLVTLQPGGTGPALVCLHALGGAASSYSFLAAELAGEHPVHALHAPALDDDVPPDDDIRHMARRYLDDLAAAGVHGPLWLAGWSFGALVAHEMAAQLAGAGRAPDGLVLVDPSWPSWPSGPSGPASPAAADEGHALRLLARELGLGPDDLADLEQPTAGDRFDRLVLAVERLGLFPAGRAAGHLHRMRRVQHAHRTALARHRPEPYQGRTLLVRALEPSDADRASLRADPSGGWTPFLVDPPELHQVAGDHHSLLRPPHVGALARLLRARLSTPRR